MNLEDVAAIIMAVCGGAIVIVVLKMIVGV